MIVRRHGMTVDQVEPEFAAVAFNEIGFVRRGGFTLEWNEFQERYERIAERLLGAEAEGHVKLEVESATLDLLAHRLAEAVGALAPGELLMVENQSGHDYPRLHEKTETLVEHGRNRLHFFYHLDPPLRLGIYRPRGD